MTNSIIDIRIESLLTSTELADYFYYSGLKRRTTSEEEKYQSLCNKLKSRRERKLAAQQRQAKK